MKERVLLKDNGSVRLFDSLDARCTKEKKRGLELERWGRGGERRRLEAPVQARGMARHGAVRTCAHTRTRGLNANDLRVD